MHIMNAISATKFGSSCKISASRKKMRIKEIPIVYYPRIGTSKLSSFTDGWRHMKFMLLYAPLNLFLIPGVVFTLFGIFGIFYTFRLGPILELKKNKQ